MRSLLRPLAIHLRTFFSALANRPLPASDSRVATTPVSHFVVLMLPVAPNRCSFDASAQSAGNTSDTAARSATHAHRSGGEHRGHPNPPLARSAGTRNHRSKTVRTVRAKPRLRSLAPLVRFWSKKPMNFSLALGLAWCWLGCGFCLADIMGPRECVRPAFFWLHDFCNFFFAPSRSL